MRDHACGAGAPGPGLRRRAGGLGALAVALLLVQPGQGGATFVSQTRALVIDADPTTQGCQQQVSTQAAGLFGALLPSACDGGITAAQQDTVIVPSSFVGGSGFARHAFGPTVYSSRSSIEIDLSVDCVVTLEVGGQLQAASAPDAVARVRLVDARGAIVYLAEAVAAGSGDVFVTLDHAVAIPAGQYQLTIEAVAEAIDMPGPDVAFVAYTVACVFTEGNAVCQWDLDADGVVDGADLGLLLAAWRSGDESCIPGGAVGRAELDALLEAWGPCGGR